MIKQFTILLFFFSLGLSIHGQDSGRIKKVQNEKTIAVNNVKENSITIIEKNNPISEETEKQNRINYLNSFIKAIDTKVDYVSADKTFKKEAKNSGWFDKMEQTKKALKKELDTLSNN